MGEQTATALDQLMAIAILDWGEAILTDLKTFIIFAVVVFGCVLGGYFLAVKKNVAAGLGGILGCIAMAVVIAMSTNIAASAAEQAEKNSGGTRTQSDFTDMFGN